MSQYRFVSIFSVLVTGALLAPSVNAQAIFSENFRSPSMPGTDGVTPCNTAPGGAGTYLFPAGWLLRNVDNLSPNFNVAWVNEAWEVREDVDQNDNNCVAFSTSYYTPTGTANDFMWSPPISIPAGGATLSWRARAVDQSFPDGYEVRVMPQASGTPTGGTGVLGNQLSGSTLVFSTGAEQATWTTHFVDLAPVAGQTVHIGFRNNEVDQYLLAIDDVTVVPAAPDVAADVATPVLPYVRVPNGLAYLPVLSVSARNAGGMPLTSITGTAQLMRNSVDVGAPVASSAEVPSLAVGATAPVAFSTPTDTINAAGTWAIRYTLSAAQSEAPEVLANNTVISPTVEVGGQELARHEGAPASALGIGAGDGGEVGVQFTLPGPLTVAGIRFNMAAKPETVDNGSGGTRPSTWAGKPIVANLRAFDGANNRPGNLIDTTVPGVTVFPANTYDLPLSGGPQLLQAGTYIVTVVEPIFAQFSEDATIQVEMHTSRFQPGTAWVNWPTSPFGNWANLEAFGVSFARTPAFSLLTSFELLKDGFETPPGSQTQATTPTHMTTRRNAEALPNLMVAKPGKR